MKKISNLMSTSGTTALPCVRAARPGATTPPIHVCECVCLIACCVAGFVCCSKADTEGIEPRTTMLLLHNFDQRRVYGCYLATRVGINIDTSVGADWIHQVRPCALLLVP